MTWGADTARGRKTCPGAFTVQDSLRWPVSRDGGGPQDPVGTGQGSRPTWEPPPPRAGPPGPPPERPPQAKSSSGPALPAFPRLALSLSAGAPGGDTKQGDGDPLPDDLSDRACQRSPRGRPMDPRPRTSTCLQLATGCQKPAGRPGRGGRLGRSRLWPLERGSRAVWGAGLETVINTSHHPEQAERLRGWQMFEL